MSDMNKPPVVAITMGDPAGVGPEVVLKAVSRRMEDGKTTFLLLGDAGVWRSLRRTLGSSVEPRLVRSTDELEPGAVNLMSLSSINLDHFQFGRSQPDLGLISTFYIIKATDLANDGRIDALVTAPINYGVLYEAGYDYPDQSSLLKDHLHSERIVPMLIGEHVRVASLTTHIPICEVPGELSEVNILSGLHLVNDFMSYNFNMSQPHIGVSALNPHASQDGRFGTEESRMISPAIRKAREEFGLNISGPIPVDNLLVDTIKGAYDVAFCMHHDQAHLAFRLLEREPGVNVTLGLPILRSAPTHGAHYELAGHGTASEAGMLKALDIAVKAAHRSREKLNTEN